MQFIVDEARRTFTYLSLYGFLTDAVIANRVNVTIRGCGARTRVLPREKTLDQPIISVVDSTRVEIEHIDFVTLGGTAIWLEGTKPGSCDDIVVAHHRILACTHAVFARNASNLVIANNRIRMFDKEGGLAAIDVFVCGKQADACAALDVIEARLDGTARFVNVIPRLGARDARVPRRGAAPGPWKRHRSR